MSLDRVNQGWLETHKEGVISQCLQAIQKTLVLCGAILEFQQSSAVAKRKTHRKPSAPRSNLLLTGSQKQSPSNENPRKAVRLRRHVWLNRCVVAIFPGAATATVVKMPVIPRRLSTREKGRGAAREDVVGVTGLPCLRLRRQSSMRRTRGSRKEGENRGGERQCWCFTARDVA